MISIRKLIFVMASVAFIGTGCSSEGSGGGAGGLARELGQLGGGISSGGTTPNSTEGSSANSMADTPPNDGLQELNKLLGRTLFGHVFSSDPSIAFVIDSTLEQSGYIVTDDGVLVLTGTAIVAFRREGEEDFTVRQPENFGCAQAGDRMLCIYFYDDGSTVNFLFDFLINGESTGNFEFCPEGTTNCFDELVNTPDGPLAVRKAETFAFAEYRNANKIDDSAGDVKQFLSYLEQSSDSLSQFTSRSSNSFQNSAILETHNAIMDVIGN